MITRLLERIPVARALVRELAFWHVARLVRGLGAELERGDGRLYVRRGDRTIVLAATHLVFGPEMARGFDGYFGAVGATGDPRVRDFSEPRNHPLPALGGSFWLAGPAERPTLLDAYFLDGAPREGELVFDMGANAGLATWHLARLVGPSGRVHSFEPDPRTREMLSRNVAQHGLAQVTIHADAVAGTDGTRRFNAEASLGAAFSDIVDRVGLASTIDVRTVTLATAAREAGSVPTFIKMDVEGAEVEILEGSRAWLREHKPAIVLDTDHRVRGEWTDAAVERILRECGYEVRTRMIEGTRLTSAWHPEGPPRRPPVIP